MLRRCVLLRVGAGLGAGMGAGMGEGKGSTPIEKFGMEHLGAAAHQLLRGMGSPESWNETSESRATAIPGKATMAGTHRCMARSSTFENWHSVCPLPVGWAMSKLGSATCKMNLETVEALDSVQLQVIKGVNVFEIDGQTSSIYQEFSQKLDEVLGAFELDREEIVIILRCGVLHQPPWTEHSRDMEINNFEALRKRSEPVLKRVENSSLPQNMMKGFMGNFADMSTEQLVHYNLRRVDSHRLAAVTPEWLVGMLMNFAHQTKIETIDVFLVEGLQTLYDGRPDEEVEADIGRIFEFLEKMVGCGVLQYYGISGKHAMPSVARVHPELPPDAMVPAELKERILMNRLPAPITLNVEKLVKIAEKVHGPDHHFKFVQYPYNLTEHTACSRPLDYDPNHTLYSKCGELGLTRLSYRPVETCDLQGMRQRYHKFPGAVDVKNMRGNMMTLLEKIVQSEMDIKRYVDKLKTPPPADHIYIGSLFVQMQRAFCNYFTTKQWADHQIMPKFRKAVRYIREGAPKEVQDWINEYETMIQDLWQLRLRLLEQRHSVESAEKNKAIDRLSPTLAECPIMAQKALNFAMTGSDCVMAGLHQSRYVHEATHLNPFKNGAMTLPQSEIEALWKSKEVSYADANPVHPYLMETPSVSQGEIAKQKPASWKIMTPIDPKNPQYPDLEEDNK